jgi:GT2 family glycosyltransferase
MSPPPRVAALVLNYNGREVTLVALGSLRKMVYPALTLVHVDNGSTDGSAEAVGEAFPDVVQLRVAENRGPARGVNLGLAWALERRYDYTLILNNDIEVDPLMLDAMVAVAESDPAIGCVGPKGYYFWDRERIWSAGGKIRFREAVTAEHGEGAIDRGQWDRDREVGYVNGCAMLVRREALEAAGLWDPLFFLGVEDADFCMRVRRAGFTCWYAHRARLWHMVSYATGVYTPGRTFNTGRNTALFVRRWGRWWQRAASVAAFAASMPVAWVRERRRGNQAAVAAKLRGFVAGWREPLTDPPAIGEPSALPEQEPVLAG